MINKTIERFMKEGRLVARSDEGWDVPGTPFTVHWHDGFYHLRIDGKPIPHPFGGTMRQKGLGHLLHTANLKWYIKSELKRVQKEKEGQK